jgi:DNA-binding NtrC family response regulator
LVEDNLVLRKIFADVLFEAGYSVLECDSAEVALDLYREHEICAVVTDERLAGSMSGSQLLTKLAEMTPYAKLVLISGEEPTRKLPAPIMFLCKPFVGGVLLSALH